MTAFGKVSLSRSSDARPGELTVIARDTVLSGELSGNTPVRVEGKVVGKLTLGAALEVAPGATVEAEVSATRVVISGTVVGNLSANELVSIESSGHLRGDVTCTALQVVEGAILEGRVTMRQDSRAAKSS